MYVFWGSFKAKAIEEIEIYIRCLLARLVHPSCYVLLICYVINSQHVSPLLT